MRWAAAVDYVVIGWRRMSVTSDGDEEEDDLIRLSSKYAVCSDEGDDWAEGGRRQRRAGRGPSCPPRAPCSLLQWRHSLQCTEAEKGRETENDLKWRTVQQSNSSDRIVPPTTLCPVLLTSSAAGHTVSPHPMRSIP